MLFWLFLPKSSIRFILHLSDFIHKSITILQQDAHQIISASDHIWEQLVMIWECGWSVYIYSVGKYSSKKKKNVTQLVIQNFVPFYINAHAEAEGDHNVWI